MPVDSIFLFRWKTEVMTNSMFLSSPLQLGCRLLSFASSPSCPQTGGCLCVSGCDVQDMWSLDFWQVINDCGFISLLLVRALAVSVSIWEPAAHGWDVMRKGLPEHAFVQADAAPASTVIDETLDRNSGLSYHLVSCLYLSGFGALRGRWGIKNCAHLPVWNLAWTGFYINGRGELQMNYKENWCVSYQSAPVESAWTIITMVTKDLGRQSLFIPVHSFPPLFSHIKSWKNIKRPAPRVVLALCEP